MTQPPLSTSLPQALAANIPGRAVFDVIGQALESHTVNECEELWNVVDAHATELRRLMRESDLVGNAALRVSNELLKRCSPNTHASLCGRLLVFLATNLPLSERSGVNLGGETFATVNLQVEKNQKTFTGTDASTDFEGYEAFWKCQDFFSRRAVIPPTTAHPMGDSGVLGTRQWSILSQCVKTTLNSFEKAIVSPSLLETTTTTTSLSKIIPSPTQTHEMPHFGLKLLPKGTLYRLQLGDERTRRLVLLQFLFFLRQIETFVGTSLDKTGTGATNAKSTLPKWRARVIALMQNTGVDGPRFCDVAMALIEKERLWERWKDEGEGPNKCQAFERQPQPLPSTPQKHESMDIVPTKRPWAPVQVWDNASREKNAAAMLTVQDKGFLPKPNLETFAQPMLDALDPANGIEDEYHPRRSYFYCWRGMRLVVKKDLNVLAKSGGQFAKATALMFRPQMEEEEEEEHDATVAGISAESITAAMDIVSTTPFDGGGGGDKEGQVEGVGDVQHMEEGDGHAVEAVLEEGEEEQQQHNLNQQQDQQLEDGVVDETQHGEDDEVGGEVHNVDEEQARSSTGVEDVSEFHTSTPYLTVVLPQHGDDDHEDVHVIERGLEQATPSADDSEGRSKRQRLEDGIDDE